LRNQADTAICRELETRSPSQEYEALNPRTIRRAPFGTMGSSTAIASRLPTPASCAIRNKKADKSILLAVKERLNPKRNRYISPFTFAE
jgi:hypothetical protein